MTNRMNMKKLIFAKYLLAHVLLMMLGAMVMLAEVFLSSGGAVSPLWALTAAPMAFAAYVTGRRLRAEKVPQRTDDHWNAAMVLYVVSLALLALLWRFPQSRAALIVNLWNFPAAPALTGFDAWLGGRVLAHGGNGFYALLRSTEKYHDLYLPVMGAVLAAIEPLCLTLGFVSGAKKTEENEKEEKTDA